MLKIGLDLDGVIFQWLPTTQRLFQSIPSNPEKTDVRAYLKSEVEKDAFDKLLDDPRWMSGLPPFPDIKEQLVPYLRNHEIYIVSNRNNPTHDASEKAVVSLGINPVEFRWSEHGEKYKNLPDLDVFIEDLPHNLKGVPYEFPVLMPLRSYNKIFLEKQREVKRKLYPYNRVDEMINVLEALNDAKQKGVLNEGRS